jgi:4-alpha-glucanotransferase
MESKRLDNAALAAGISPSYINAHGKPQSIGAETKRRLLDAMHKATPVAKAAVTAVPNVKVFTSGKKMPLMIEGSGAFSWLLTTETGQLYKGDATGGKNLNLPAKLPEGYHTLTLTQDDQRWHCRVIVAPRRCYEPQALLEGKKLWGACVQLYTLRSASNWGIGDFGDLKAMLADVGERGGAFIGLNPIHALYPANPESASPYSPSSRRWLNVIYIDVNALDDFKNSKEAQAWWALSTTQQTLKQARDAEWVDYATVTALKMAALRMAWKSFSQRDDAQMSAFRQFVTAEGESLYWQAAFDALHAYQVKEDEMRWGGASYPRPLKRCLPMLG